MRAERRETDKTASCQLADEEDSFQGLQAKIVAITVEREERYNLLTEISDKLITAEAYVAIQLLLRGASLMDVDARSAKLADLQEQLAAKDA